MTPKRRSERNERIDLAKERLTQLRQEFCDIDFAKASLEVSQNEYLSPKEAAEILGIQANQARKLAKNNKCGLRVAGASIFTKQEVRKRKEAEIRPGPVAKKNS